MHRFRLAAPAAALAIAAAAVPAAAQLTLRDALRVADRSAYANRIARGAAVAADAQVAAPLAGILPNARFEAGYVRTTDPVAAFGTSLRQRGINQAAFDPARLNFPAAIGNYTVGAVLEAPLLNADAWAGRAAARAAADAAYAGADWTRVGQHVDVIGAWYGAVLAHERARTLDAALAAARAHVAQAEALHRNGLATKADLLLAQVRAGEIEAQAADAHAGVETSRRGLQVLLGGPRAGEPVLPAMLPTADVIRTVVAADTVARPVATRGDLQQAEASRSAAQWDRRRAQGSWLPRINSFARWDWNNAARLLGGREMWTAGVMASIPLFGTGANWADLQATGGRAAQAQAGVEAAHAQADLEAFETASALAVALQRLAISEQAVLQSTDAHRLVARRYEGGLATIAELLDAQAAEVRSRLGHAESRWHAIATAARRRRALGLDPSTLAVLDDATTVADR